MEMRTHNIKKSRRVAKERQSQIEKREREKQNTSMPKN